MKIGIVIDHVSELYMWQWMGNSDHQYIIYWDQLKQDSHHTTTSHYHHTMHQGIEYLINEGVDHIICPPTIELHYNTQYPQILPIFQQYLTHALQYSIVGKIGFVGSTVQCQDINLHRGEIKEQHKPATKQVSNHHYNSTLPIWTSIDTQLTHWLQDHKPDHFITNHIIKGLLRPLKDANVDTIIGLDWAYYGCDVSFTHHCRSIRWHRSSILQEILNSLNLPNSPTGYNIAIHHTGTLHDLEQNKQLRWLLARGQNYEIQKIIID